MPLYEYRCPWCGEKFEKLVRSLSTGEEVLCPSCGARVTRRLPTVFGRVGGNGVHLDCPPSASS